MKNSLLLALSLTLGACSPAGGGSDAATAEATGTLYVEITDKFLSSSQVDEARITIGRIEIHSESDGGFKTLFDGPPADVNLTNLQNGLRSLLVQSELPVGSYRQVRLILTDAYLRLTNGNEYRTGDGTMKLSSQATSGWKVFIDPEVVVVSGLGQTLLLDVDLGKTFKPTPANDPLNASTYKMHPVLRAVNLSDTGEIRGVVTVDDGTGDLVAAEGVDVHVFLPGETDPDQSVGSTVTMVDGDYAIIGLPPGLYDVEATDGTLSARVNGRTVAVANVTAVDLTIE